MSLSRNDLKSFRLLLNQRRADIEQVKETGEGAASVVELDQTRVGRLSRMDAMQAQAMSVETNRRREIEIQRIGTALQRIESGDYGYCVSCDEEINRLRLDVDPATPICIDCAAAK